MNRAFVRFPKPCQNKKGRKIFQVHSFQCLFFTAGSWEKDTENCAPEIFFGPSYFEAALAQIFKIEKMPLFDRDARRARSGPTIYFVGWLPGLIKNLLFHHVLEYFIMFKNISSYISLDWIKLDQIGSNWFKLDPNWSNYFES